ncbi:MAG TPA: isocitrate/isopropylmalate dehydrogenase family protein [Planctomycetota bacterium]|nr:isocitrate/isopropylmalate dehydrogenase family protein [Planctomycetota bacterium]HRR80635.1 isocitrate/isopropylmalate dehydrogenase family protein [Planctomycetota bacterium]HRT97261.1 isocitrate/isopropylmalate dehydrogenase family protein [Planctomycetota bacterium]
MSTTPITLIPGDGIGPEVIEAAVRVVETLCPDVRWERYPAGQPACNETGEFLPEALLDSVRRNHIALKGPVTTPVGCGFRSVNVALRKKLALYAGVRPARNRPGLASRYAGVDIVVVRENTEGLYAGIEHELLPGIVETVKVTTEVASRRIAAFAFDFARRWGRRRVTVLHKANIMKLTDGLFLACAREAAKSYPDVAFEELLLDNACLQLVTDPSRFDVLLTDSLVGDLVSDLCAGLVGGIGLAAGMNVGDGCAVFEAVHGSAPDIAGTGRANPLAAILTAALMLRHLGRTREAERVEAAVDAILPDPASLTPDLGGTATTREVADAVCRKLQE